MPDPMACHTVEDGDEGQEAGHGSRSRANQPSPVFAIVLLSMYSTCVPVYLCTCVPKYRTVQSVGRLRPVPKRTFLGSAEGQSQPYFPFPVAASASSGYFSILTTLPRSRASDWPRGEVGKLTQGYYRGDGGTLNADGLILVSK